MLQAGGLSGLQQSGILGVASQVPKHQTDSRKAGSFRDGSRVRLAPLDRAPVV